MLATALKSDVWNISPEEAAKLAEAIARVQAEYQIALTPKQQAWINLAMVGGSVYGSRFMVDRMLRKSAKRPTVQANAPAPAAQPEVAQTEVAADGWREGFGPAPDPAKMVNPSELVPPWMRGAGQ